jgi:hypothetical protein
VLGIPPGHYAAWQLVSGAITSYAHANAFPHRMGQTVSPQAATIAGQLHRLWEQLGRLRHTTAGDEIPDGVRELIGELCVLTDWLLAEPAEAAAGLEAHGAEATRG